jgi:hypothetical protein
MHTSKLKTQNSTNGFEINVGGKVFEIGGGTRGSVPGLKSPHGFKNSDIIML